MGGTKNHFTLTRVPNWKISEYKGPHTLHLSDVLQIAIFGEDGGKPVPTVASISE